MHCQAPDGIRARSGGLRCQVHLLQVEVKYQVVGPMLTDDIPMEFSPSLHLVHQISVFFVCPRLPALGEEPLHYTGEVEAVHQRRPQLAEKGTHPSRRHDVGGIGPSAEEVATYQCSACSHILHLKGGIRESFPGYTKTSEDIAVVASVGKAQSMEHYAHDGALKAVLPPRHVGFEAPST